MKNPLKTEPALLVGALVSVLLIFGVELTETDAEAITQVLALIFSMAGAFAVRQNVTPVARAEEREVQAAEAAYRDIEIGG